ncbi:hypothetical protein, partial [Chthonomonas calidirosea]|uniref:hypothetical protein n=1 Tax=Chthonomonas calidirosea TaxID=454171 RepID=UPI0006ECBB49
RRANRHRSLLIQIHHQEGVTTAAVVVGVAHRVLVLSNAQGQQAPAVLQVVQLLHVRMAQKLLLFVPS